MFFIFIIKPGQCLCFSFVNITKCYGSCARVDLIQLETTREWVKVQANKLIIKEVIILGTNEKIRKVFSILALEVEMPLFFLFDLNWTNYFNGPIWTPWGTPSSKEIHTGCDDPI